MTRPWQDPVICEDLAAKPSATIQQFGLVIDQETNEIVQYNPYKITRQLQATVCAYVDDPLRNDNGETRWLNVLKYRQAGCSLSTELAFYPKAAYQPGWRHSCTADTKERADTLHERVQFTHSRWEEQFRTPNKNTNETRSISFVNGSSMIVQSAHVEDVGIGQSLSSWHGSELPWWKNAGKVYSLVLPSMVNRKNSLMVLESTPSTMDESSAEWWRDKCYEAAKWREDPIGRDLYAFFPYWDGLLNRRPWPKGARPDAEEVRLMERFGPLGLQPENLAFRRLMLSTDPEIRKNHQLFDTYYPSDDISCWMTQGGGIIAPHILTKFLKARLVDFEYPYTCFEPVQADAVYVIGVDPAGFAGRDHGAFVVLKVYHGEWTVVASFSGIIDPKDFGERLHKEAVYYNNAMVAIERNQGQGAIVFMQTMKYRNLYYENGQPGVWSSNIEKETSELVTHLLDELVIPDRDLIAQLQGYRNDRLVQLNAKALTLGHKAGKRRARHHWDKVSALIMACAAARVAPRRYKPEPLVLPANVIPFMSMSLNAQEAYLKQVADKERARQNGRKSHYSSIRRRRK